jgi:hypothetical protein
MKNLTLYEKINKVCSLGKHAIVKTQYGDYFIISPYKNDFGTWRESISYRDIENCKSVIGHDAGCDVEGWNLREKVGFEYIGVYQPEPYERFQVGDKVRNFATGKKYTIELVIDEVFYVCRENYNTTISLSHDELEPVFEEEKEVIEVDGKKYDKAVLLERIKELPVIK